MALSSIKKHQVQRNWKHHCCESNQKWSVMEVTCSGIASPASDAGCSCWAGTPFLLGSALSSFTAWAAPVSAPGLVVEECPKSGWLLEVLATSSSSPAASGGKNLLGKIAQWSGNEQPPRWREWWTQRRAGCQCLGVRVQRSLQQCLHRGCAARED